MRTPNKAGAKRHPTELSGPNSHIPPAMSHLPSWGCTTYAACVPIAEKSPRTNNVLAPSAHTAS